LPLQYGTVAKKSFTEVKNIFFDLKKYSFFLQVKFFSIFGIKKRNRLDPNPDPKY